MILLKFVSVATLLTLAVGCRTSGNTQSDGQPSWARHEGISRTYTSGVTSLTVNHSSALSNDDSSRTYDTSPALVADDMLLRGYNDDTSRTFHSSGATSIDEHGPVSIEVKKTKPANPSGYYYSDPVSDSSSTAAVKN